jgi:TPR repeat protein
VAEDHAEPEAFSRAGSHLFNLGRQQEGVAYYLRGQKAGDWGFNCAMHLASCYTKGTGVTRNVEEASRLYQEVSEYSRSKQAPLPAATRVLFILINTCHSLIRSRQVITGAHEAKNGSAWAKSMVGMHEVLSGLGKAEEARKLVSKVVKGLGLGEWEKQDPTQCSSSVASMYIREMVSSLGALPRAAEHAEAWAKKGADLKDASCMAQYGQMLGLRGKYKLASVKLHAAAIAGSSLAAFTLGRLYATGKNGIEVDLERATHYLLQSAKQGGGAAMVLMSKCYTCGFGVAKDDEQAAFWAAKANTDETNPVFRQTNCDYESAMHADGTVVLARGGQVSHIPILDDLVKNGTDVTGLSYSCSIVEHGGQRCLKVTFDRDLTSRDVCRSDGAGFVRAPLPPCAEPAAPLPSAPLPSTAHAPTARVIHAPTARGFVVRPAPDLTPESPAVATSCTPATPATPATPDTATPATPDSPAPAPAPFVLPTDTPAHVPPPSTPGLPATAPTDGAFGGFGTGSTIGGFTLGSLGPAKKPGRRIVKTKRRRKPGA